jgi:hypothetical protein
MKLEQQVVSLELAKKLKELGVKQESIFYYAHQGKIWSREHYYDNYNSNDENDQEAVTFEYYLSEVNGGQIYSAYTVAELGDIFPVNIQLPFKDIEYWKWSSPKGRHTSPTEADARAKMLIHLIENQFITL